MTLLVDASSGVLRYAQLTRAGMTDAAVMPYRGVEPDEWSAVLGAMSPAPRRVLVANGSGGPFAQRFAAWVLHEWNVIAEFPQALRRAGGIHNGHAAPDTLPVNRWLCLLAARVRATGALVVVVAGPAFSVDLVDAQGEHRGGYTLPGPRLMREALHGQTSGVAAAALLDTAAVDGVFGINTAGAVRQGALLALASLVDRLAAELGERAGAPTVLVTGSDAVDVARLLARPGGALADLVLEGLACVASGAAA